MTVALYEKKPARDSLLQSVVTVENEIGISDSNARDTKQSPIIM